MWDDPPEKKLEILQATWKYEEAVIRYLEFWGFLVLHRGKSSGVEQHGPRFYVPHKVSNRNLPVPDLEAFWPHLGTRLSHKGLPSHFFADVKAKGACSYYRKNGRWQSGIDRWCCELYREVERFTFTPTLVFHLIEPTSVEAMDQQQVPVEDRPAPTGLYWHPILQKISDDYRNMVYWAVKDMQKLAELDEVLP